MLYKLTNIQRLHGNRVVLDIPELELLGGKIYTLVGPNGAGKTTLLHLLAFLDAPTRGEIIFKGQRVRHDATILQLRRKVVLVDQYPLLFSEPVWKNLEFGLKIRKMRKKERQERVERALELVGMQEFYNSAAHVLSGGETKRIALARALVLEPEVLLCDEPTANVDTEHQEILLQILERSNREGELSIIFATHYLGQAQRLAHHSLVLQNGRLSSEARDNVFFAKRVQRKEFDRYRLDQKVELVVPRNDTAGAENCKVHLDPLKLKLESETCEDGVNVFPGMVMKTGMENGNIRIVVDTGIRLQLFLSPEEYRKRLLWIGEKVCVRVPQDAIAINF